MPRRKTTAPPKHSRPDLVQTLAEEVRKEGVSSTPHVPTVYQEEQPYGDNLHVTVIWDEWAELPAEERGAIILDAYAQAGLEDERRRITLALGLTEAESKRLGLGP